MNESITVSLSGKMTSLSSTYFPAINLQENSEIAMLCLHTYNTFPNVNETNNNIRIITPTHNLDIKLPFGCYEIEDITQYISSKIHEDNERINSVMDNNKKYYDPIDFTMNTDVTRMKCVINCNYPVDFTIENSLASLLGFKKKLYGNEGVTHFRASKNIDINAVNSIKVLCNIANGSFDNGIQSHSIYEFFPRERSGAKIVESPTNLIYYKLNTEVINTINISLVDQENNPIHNFEEKITVVLHIRHCKS
jgi:hypothetical protein